MAPLWPPATGGSATYYPLLVKHLLDQDRFDQIHIVTEAASKAGCRKEMAGLVDDRLFIHDFLPIRIQRSTRPGPILHSLIYVVQNIFYFRLRSIIRAFDIGSVVIHSGFFLAPSIMGWLTGALIFPKNVVKIADIRESRSPNRRSAFCDIRIFCSENCYYSYSHGLKPQDFMLAIPFNSNPIEPEELSKEVRDKLDSLGKSPTIAYIGMLREIKNTHLAISAFERLRKSKYPNALLVLAGQIREETRSRLHKEILNNPSILYLGELDRNDTYCLIQHCDLVINPSMIESISRVCLEALSQKKKVLCPSNIPEYATTIPDWTVDGSNEEELVHKISWALEQKSGPKFSFDKFEPSTIARDFATIVTDYHRCSMF